MFDFVQTGVAALRSGRNKANVSYANDEEGFGGAALSNTTLASDNDEEDEDDEDEDEEEEEDSESEGEEDGDDEEEDSGSENKRAKKKQRFAASNGEDNKKRKRTLARSANANAMERGNFKFLLAKELKKKTKTMKEEIKFAVEKINDNNNKVLANAEKKAVEFNFTVGSGAYVALVVLLAGEAVGIPGMTPTTIVEFARQLGLEGKTKTGKKTKMDHSTIWAAVKSDSSNFVRDEDAGTYSPAKELEKKEKTMKKTKTMTKEEIKFAVEKINDNNNKVLANAEKKAVEFNFTVGSGAYVALVVLLAGEAVGIPGMNPNRIEEFARQLGLEGKTKTGKKTVMDRSTIWAAMERDKTNFVRDEDAGTYSPAKELEKKETKKKKEKEERKSEPRVVHVKRGEWGLMKFEDVLFYGNENKWCPLCDGRTVVNRTFVMFYSHWILVDMAEEVVIEHYGNEKKIKTERVKKALDYYFEEKLKTNPGPDIKSFDDVCRQSEELCHHCWTKLEKWLKQP